MDKDQVIAIIRKHEDALRAEGVLGLSLFGSVARGEATAESDIDVIVELTDEVLHSGFGYFGTLYRLKERLEDITGRPVDVVSEPIEKPRLAKEIERDRQVAFYQTVAPSGLPGHDWQGIRGIGNILRHDYANVMLPRIWELIEKNIRPLLRDIELAIEAHDAADK